ncbi:hypothetical protein Pint_34583 [Pistacia integerrima]|uniref:Uncharacterized protein n=1 Tax=Pistacia integerrima TaxID=434235 RepID=A0ACC0X633_9ROSI|nr:hypothetical protein Pint_34583 [Pistacia integerrima]
MPNTHLPTLMFEAMQQQQPFESPDQCHQSGLDASPNVVGDAPLTIPGEIIKAASDFKGAANVSDQGFLDESEDNDQKNFTVQHSIANPDLQLPESAEKKVKTTPSLPFFLFLYPIAYPCGDESPTLLVGCSLNLLWIVSADFLSVPLDRRWIELRKERKRQSNRESAKRSRMRKQVQSIHSWLDSNSSFGFQEEIKILQAQMQEVKAQSSMLKDKLLSLAEECEKLKDENKSLMVEIKQMDKPDAFSQFLQLLNGEINISKLIPSLEYSTPHQSSDSSPSNSKD